MTDPQQHGAPRTLDVQCCVVGGGPAGMMLGYLLGRAGIETAVLEKHADFFRDFRGDTVHPSTLQVMDELGLIDDFLKLPHDKLQKLEGYFGAAKLRLADISRTGAKHPFIAFMPQWDFLNFLRDKGQRYPKLKVLMSTEATDLIWANRAVCGVAARDAEGPLAINARLVVACDGRHSTVRVCAGLNVEEIGAPMDVLWFRVGKGAESESVLARIEPGQMMITLDRGDYWQCAYVIAKGQYDAVKARGLDAFLAGKGVQLPGGKVFALFQARVLGHVYNPLSLYWCHDADGVLRYVIAEVHNTHGERHAYLLPPSGVQPTMVDKKLYASPFNDVDGHYLINAPHPDEHLDLRISLHRENHPAFVTTMRGDRRAAGIGQILALQVISPLAPKMNSLSMRVQGTMLRLRRVPVVPHPAEEREKVYHS